VRWVDFEGKEIAIHGAMTTPRPPQGRPVYMQAGSSPRGREFAARWAEAVFTVQQEKSLMREFYADMKRRVIAAGRDPATCAILPAVDVIVAHTLNAAQAEADYLDSLASVELGLQTLTNLSGTDMAKWPLETPLASIPVDAERTVSIGLYQNVLAIRRDDGAGGMRVLTLGEAARLYATTWMAPRIVGTPAMVADRMQELLEDECCDGFVLGTSSLPMGLANFVDLVVPELQRRDIYRTAYTGRTFRENLHN
jgi:alkanesulfonate monooxygenase SsuD/methylene tetrahydromethanopterin reductase-like flavin-dependent oxidoreductase (luciferase family)